MSTKLSPYLSFDGEAKDAMEFYHSVFGGQLTASTFGDFGMEVAAGDEGKIMHSQLTYDNGDMLMAADTPEGMPKPSGVQQVALSGDDDATLRQWFDGLAAGGNVLEPVTVAPWGDAFGMLTDKFGVLWMINIAGQQA